MAAETDARAAAARLGGEVSEPAESQTRRPARIQNISFAEIVV